MLKATYAVRVLTSLVLTLVLVACASSQYPPAPRLAASSDYRYVIGPLDTLNIVVWRNPELSGTVSVRPDGRISTPLAILSRWDGLRSPTRVVPFCVVSAVFSSSCSVSQPISAYRLQNGA